MVHPRPETRPRTPVHGYRRRQRWPGFSWWLSALFVVGITALAVTLLVDTDNNDPPAQSMETVAIAVVDSTSGQPLPGAAVQIGALAAQTDESGVARLSYSSEPMMITVTREGYHAAYGRIDATMSLDQQVALNPAPAGSAGAEQPAAATGGETSAPAGAAVVVQADTSTTSSDSPSSGEPGVSGTVVDEDGLPISTATILAGSEVVFSDEDGRFELPNSAAGTQLRVWASGYADQFPMAAYDGDVTVQLTRMDVKAAYLTGARLNDEAKIAELIEVIERTELNALVVDIKEGVVYYDTGIQFFRDADAVSPVFDPAALVQRLKDHGIYTIARIVVFNDPIVAQNRPDLALKDDNGGIWEGWNGGAWVDPFYRELWQPNIDMAVEAARMGFDEIQYDYVRFPSDGDLSTANFAGDYTEANRVSTIVEFLEMTQEQLRPLGAKLGADVFGIIAVYPEDQGIGQRMSDFAAIVDFVHPMIYPSHFDVGSISVDGHPNDFPYETLDISVGLGVAKIPGMELKMRPWLQDFTLGEREYGPEEVRAQIDATMKHGSSGWMLWNADSSVTEGAMEPRS